MVGDHLHRCGQLEPHADAGETARGTQRHCHGRRCDGIGVGRGEADVVVVDLHHEVGRIVLHAAELSVRAGERDLIASLQPGVAGEENRVACHGTHRRRHTRCKIEQHVRAGHGAVDGDVDHRGRLGQGGHAAGRECDVCGVDDHDEVGCFFKEIRATGHAIEKHLLASVETMVRREGDLVRGGVDAGNGQRHCRRRVAAVHAVPADLDACHGAVHGDIDQHGIGGDGSNVAGRQLDVGGIDLHDEVGLLGPQVRDARNAAQEDLVAGVQSMAGGKCDGVAGRVDRRHAAGCDLCGVRARGRVAIFEQRDHRDRAVHVDRQGNRGLRDGGADTVVGKPDVSIVDLHDVIRHIVIEARDARCTAQEDLVAGVQPMGGCEGDRISGGGLAACGDVDDIEHGDRADDGVALGIAIGLPVGVIVLGRGALLRPDGTPRGLRRQAAAELQICIERTRLRFGQRLRLLVEGVENPAAGRLEPHVTASGPDRPQGGGPQRRRDEPEVVGRFEDEDAVLRIGCQAARSIRVTVDPDRLTRRANAARRGQ